MKKMNKIMGRIVSMISVSALAVCLFTGCMLKKFDAEGYVKACMDALYKGEYEEYADATGLSLEEAQADIEDNFQASMDEAFLGDAVTPQEDKDAYKEAILNIYSLAKYEVTGSEEKDGDFVVTVDIWPSNAFENLETAFQDRVTQEMESGSYDDSKVIAYLSEYLQEAAAANQYGEKVQLEVNVVRDSGNVYTIPEEDLTAIESALFPGAV